MDFLSRVDQLRSTLDQDVPLVFIPLSADLQYLCGVERDFPSFGAIHYPGDWIEGLWIPSRNDPVLVLTRMRAEFHNPVVSDISVKVIGDSEDPFGFIQSILSYFSLPGSPRIGLGRTAQAETIFHLNQLFPGASFTPVSEAVTRMRMIKEPGEIEAMREAGRMTESAFGNVIDKLHHGMTELDVLSEVDYQLRLHGSIGPSFTTAVYCSGPGHPLIFGDQKLSWGRELNPPVTILFDMGAVYKGYCYDYGRTVMFGEPTAETLKVHQLVMESQAKGIQAMRAGAITCREVDGIAREVIAQAGYGDQFRHRLGHGIGFDVHEPPFLTASDHTTLEDGMLFTVEPSIMLDRSFSARVEDVVLVTGQGGSKLTTGYQNLIVID